MISKKKKIIEIYVDDTINSDNYLNYFEKYRIFLTKNTFKNLTKDILHL